MLQQLLVLWHFVEEVLWIAVVQMFDLIGANVDFGAVNEAAHFVLDDAAHVILVFDLEAVVEVADG